MGAESDKETAPVSLTLSVSAGDAGAVALNSGGLSAAKSGHVEITRARLLVRAIQFHARDNDDGTESDAGEDTEEEGLDFRTDPMVIELDLTGSPTQVDVAEIPVGTYHKVSFRIHKPEDDADLAGTEFEDFKTDDGRFSMLIEGLLDGEPFTFEARSAFQQKVILDPDLVVDEDFEGPLNVALTVDVSRWFVGRDGSDLDPTSDRPAVIRAIEKSIRDSFRAFPDHDRDGRRGQSEDRRQDGDRGNNGRGRNG